MLLSTAYFPPVSWFAALAYDFTLSADPDGVKSFPVMLEACENYRKQSWRNRCMILGANGPEPLSFPVVHSKRMGITEVKVDYSTPWVVRTERAIASAYESSPFFEYYMDGIFGILDSCPETLWELNLRLIEFFSVKLGLPVEIIPTTEFSAPPADVRATSDNGLARDLRYAISPKSPDIILSALGLERPYYQVFSQKFGFVPNLSVMDLLFNMGPESILYIKKLTL